MPNDPYAALRRPAYRRFLTMALTNNLANQILTVVAGWHLYERTGSAWSLAGLGLAAYLPIFLLSLPAGWAADHFDRRKVLGLAFLVQVLAIAGLLANETLGGPTWPWYALLFLHACGRALVTPSSVSLYPLLIETAEVPRAVSWNSANYQFGAVVGPALGGLLLASLGPQGTLSLVLLAPLACLSLLPGIKILRQPPQPKQDEALREKLLGGFKFVWREQAMFAALSLDFVAVLVGGVEGIMPIFAKDILHCGPIGLGLLKAAPFAGALVMSFGLAHWHGFKRPGRAMLIAVAGFGLCMLLFAWSRWLSLSLSALFAAGALDQISVWVRQTLVQLRTPEHLRGRVQAVNFLFIGSSNELGEVESGLGAALVGPQAIVVVGGLGVLTVVILWARYFPALRKLEPF